MISWRRLRMKTLRHIVLPVVLATAWVGISEFVRNQLLFTSFWVEHYHRLGLVFPSAPINGAIWGVWSLLFAVSIFVVTRRFSRLESTLLSWLYGFVMMWAVIGNLGVLPYRLLIFAVPLSLLEAFLAVLIVDVTSPAGARGRAR
jgi:hypothetical protein